MNLDFHWINLIILFGAVHGLIFGFIVLLNKKHPGAPFLGLFMFVLAYNGFETLNWSAGLDQYILFFDLFPFIVIFAAGPSLYLYVTRLLHPEGALSTKKILAHYSIAGLQLIFRSVIVILYFLWKDGIIQDKTIPEWLLAAYSSYSEPLSVIVFLVYLGATLQQFRKFKQTHNQSGFRQVKRPILKWMNSLLLCMTLLGLLWPLTVLAPSLIPSLPYDVHYYPIEVLLVLFIYWIAFAGYHYTKAIDQQAVRSQDVVPSGEAKEVLARLRDIMEREKPYLDPRLNLHKLAFAAGIPAKRISTILNQHARHSFSDFVNEYRMREVKAKLLTPENQHLTISGIALESGFNSHATFQRVFRTATGMSPRKYVARQMEERRDADFSLAGNKPQIPPR